MAVADEAFIARHRGDSKLAKTLTRRAFELEVAAAELVREDLSAEPTRSILYRSAASLAMEIGELREAERLIAIALTGNPPQEIAEELRELLDQVHFSRHLQLRGVEIDPGELQFSIAGHAVGFGIALSEVFIDRIKDLEKIIYRTVERLSGLPFRERGSTRRSIHEGYHLWIAAPRPGSFAVTLRLGRQTQLPGFDISSDVVNEVIECFDLLNSGQENLLRQKMPEEAYYHNFVGLAKRIAPDGDDVTLVGLTTVQHGDERKLAVVRPKQEISVGTRNDRADEGGAFVQVRGRLLLADATKATGRIKLIDEQGKSYNIVVPEGMMNDIVRPLWNDNVVVSGNRVGKNKIYLKDINPARE